MADFVSIGIQNNSQVTINLNNVSAIEKNSNTDFAVIVMTNGSKYYTEIKYDIFITNNWLTILNS